MLEILTTYFNRDNTYTSGMSLLTIEWVSSQASLEREGRLIPFLLCLLPSAADVQTSPAQVHGAKVRKKMYMCKKSLLLLP